MFTSLGDLVLCLRKTPLENSILSCSISTGLLATLQAPAVRMARSAEPELVHTASLQFRAVFVSAGNGDAEEFQGENEVVITRLMMHLEGGSSVIVSLSEIVSCDSMFVTRDL
jgi:hypothetical protein